MTAGVSPLSDVVECAGGLSYDVSRSKRPENHLLAVLADPRGGWGDWTTAME